MQKVRLRDTEMGYKKCREPGVVAHFCNPSREAEADELCEFKAS